MFRQFEKPMTNDVTLTSLNTKNPIFSTVDSSLIGKDCVLFRIYNKGKRDAISFIYRISQLKNENSVLPVVRLSDW